MPLEFAGIRNRWFPGWLWGHRPRPRNVGWKKSPKLRPQTARDSSLIVGKIWLTYSVPVLCLPKEITRNSEAALPGEARAREDAGQVWKAMAGSETANSLFKWEKKHHRRRYLLPPPYTSAQ